MHRYLSYDDEMKRLQTLLAEVSTDEESINEEDDETVDAEQYSDHQSSSEDDLDSSSDSDIIESVDYYISKDKITNWNKKEPRRNVRTPAHNILSKLPGNIGDARNVSCPMDSWQLLIDETIITSIVECTNIYMKYLLANF